MKGWKAGKLESWKAGKLESWKAGKLAARSSKANQNPHPVIPELSYREVTNLSRHDFIC
ncbi:hypothetical protein [Psychromonas sp. MB-3u-54]|uniref:hypothetical protein n=1 Tax=Psychromonas sp. MB-3u-54 TaxID=2058319 RepID=UPI0012FF36B6|nr:hypothetical protein [Psychromonas sp. MB-3u-54]